VYLSGSWVHGDSADLTTDLSPCGKNEKVKPHELVAWREGLEEQVLQSRDILEVVILRAGLLYGGSGSHFQMWFGPLIKAIKTSKSNSALELPGKPQAYLPLIHRDDLAEGVLKGVEKLEMLSTISYPLFDLVGSVERLSDVVHAAAKSLKFDGNISFRAPSNPFEDAMSTQVIIDVSRTKAVLGWEPKHWSMEHNAEIYVKAFEANLS